MTIKSIPILGKMYKIQYSSDKNMSGLYGSANRHKAVIRLNNEISKEQQEETLLHEILHIVSDELVLGLVEESVARLAVGLYSAGYHVPAGGKK